MVSVSKAMRPATQRKKSMALNDCKTGAESLGGWEEGRPQMEVERARKVLSRPVRLDRAHIRPSRVHLSDLVSRGYRPGRAWGRDVLLGPAGTFYPLAPFGGAVALSYVAWLVSQTEGGHP
jgi:hypothetical protein